MSQVIENSYVLAEEKDRSSLSPLSKLLTSNEKVANDLEARSDERASRLTQWMIISGSQYLSSAIFAIVHGLIFTYGFRKSYTGADLTVVRSTFGSTLPIANAAALVLYFDLAILVFPVCQTFISLYSRTPLSAVIAFDGNSHRVVAHYLICFTWVHTTAHWTHFAQLAKKHNTGFNGFLIINLFTGPGWSGHIMLIVLMLMVVTSFKGLRQGSFQRFYYIHHLFVIFFVVLSIHGGFCMIRLDTAPGGTPFCAKCGSLWQWLMYGGLGWLLGERIMGEVRGRYKTHISKVIRHPANVVEIQVKKENTTTNIGQFIYVSCPEISLWQRRRLTLTSAPEEDFLSVHIQCTDNFTKALAASVGCAFEQGDNGKGVKESAVVSIDQTAALDTDPTIRKVLPRVFIDGPFGGTPDIFKHEIAVLIAAGTGITPFASILKSTWYRMNYPYHDKLRKVYFFWICDDESLGWFWSLLMAIEAQDMDNNIEVHTYLNRQTHPRHISCTNDSRDFAAFHASKELRVPMIPGPPNWDAIFKSIRLLHFPDQASVVFSGPPDLGRRLRASCYKHSRDGFRFIWKKSSF